ncbi:hypothetical protein KJ853_01335 [Patescibacteria group bacterium]|nr:hypothetical protein [Patescibacteria group bacterium]
MKEKDLISKIQLLKQIKPQKDWVVFCRANLAVRIRLERKQELLNSDIFALQGLFSFLRGIRPHYVFKALYAVSLALAIVLAGGGLTVWAAMKSLPGSPFYGVKIAMEKAYLSVVSAEEKNKLQGEMTNRRLQELRAVLDSSGSAADKGEKAKMVVKQIQQQLNTTKDGLPKLSQKESKTSVSVTKAAKEQADQIGKALMSARESLSGEVNQNLGEKMAEAAETADKTSTQALEILSKSSSVDQTEVLAGVQNKIQQIEDKIKAVEGKIAAAAPVADKLPIRAVLIKDQSDKAQELLNQAKDSLQKKDISGALESLKAAAEIANGAERIAEGLLIPIDTKTDSNASSTSSPGAGSIQ